MRGNYFTDWGRDSPVWTRSNICLCAKVISDIRDRDGVIKNSEGERKKGRRRLAPAASACATRERAEGLYDEIA